MKRIIKKSFVFLLVFVTALSFSLVGCKKKGNSDNSSSGGGNSGSQEQEYDITLDKTELTLAEDETATLIATTESKERIKWESSDKAVVSVTSGKIIAKAAGSSTVTATVGKRSATCVVTVVSQNASEYLKADKSTYMLALSDRIPTKIDAAKYNKTESGEVKSQDPVTFKSLNEQVVTVAADGTMTAVKEGKTEIEVTSGALSIKVVADVYTAAISTPEEWLDMIKSEDYMTDNTKRFYLANHISMRGVAYDISPLYEDENYFSAEVNGNMKTVSDIKLTRRISSIFGKVWGASVYNISFENVEFTSQCETGSVLADIVTTHDLNSDLSKIISDNGGVDKATAVGALRDCSFKNIAISATYACQVNYGLVRTLYGGTFENIFIEMRGANGTLHSGTVVGGAYYWGTRGKITNVVTYAHGAAVELVGGKYDTGGVISANYICESLAETAYRAYSAFDSAIWNIVPDELPTLK